MLTTTGSDRNIAPTCYQIELYIETFHQRERTLRLRRSYKGLRYEGVDNELPLDDTGRVDEALAINILIQHAHKLEKLREDLERMLLGHYPKVVVKKYLKTPLVKKEEMVSQQAV